MIKEPIKKIEGNYYFTQSIILDEKIERVWYFLCNPLFYKEIFPSNFLNFKINQKSKTFCPGDEFSIYWTGVSNISMKFISKIDRFYKKKLIFDVLINIGIFYRKTYHLYKISNNQKTLLKLIISKISNNKNENINFISFIKLNENIYSSELDNLNKLLNKRKDYLFAVESFIVNKNNKDSWNIITDFKKLSNLFPIIGSNFSYQGNQYKKGSFVKCFFPKDNKNIFMKVVECDKNIKKKNWKYILESFGADIRYIKQDIRIQTNKINDNKTQISVVHIFKQFLTKEYIDSFSKKKNEIINEIKKYLNNI